MQNRKSKSAFRSGLVGLLVLATVGVLAGCGGAETTGTVPADEVPVVAFPIGLELELARMSPEDRAEFEEEMGVGETDRDQLIRTILEASGRMLFFTCNDF